MQPAFTVGVGLDRYVNSPQFIKTSQAIDGIFEGVAQTQLPKDLRKKRGEPPRTYQDRLLSEVDKRITDKKNLPEDDWILSRLLIKDSFQATEFSQAIAAKREILKRESEKIKEEEEFDVLEKLRAHFGGESEDYVRKTVGNEGDRKRSEGRLPYFSQKEKGLIDPRAKAAKDAAIFVSGELEKVPVGKADILNSFKRTVHPEAYSILSGIVSDIRESGETLSYGAVFARLKDKFGHMSLLDPERFEVKRALAGVRYKFYKDAEWALKERRSVAEGTAGVPVNLDKIKGVVSDMAQRLNQLSTEIKRPEIYFNTALRGMDRMRRTAKEPRKNPKLKYVRPGVKPEISIGPVASEATPAESDSANFSPIPEPAPIEEQIPWEVFVSHPEPAKAELEPEVLPELDEPEPAPIINPEPAKPASPIEPPAEPAAEPWPSAPTPVAPAPTPVESWPLPTIETSPPVASDVTPPVEPARLEDPLPAGEPELQPRPQPQPQPPQEPQQEEEPLFHEINVGFAVLKDRGIQNDLRNAEFTFFKDNARTGLRDKILGRAYEIRLFGRLIHMLAHPVTDIWQNSIGKPFFELQNSRFAADIDVITRRLTHVDKSIPIALNEEILNSALNQAEIIRKNLNPIKKIYYSARDTIVGLTGGMQNSRQILAKRWLLANGSNIVDAALRKSIESQTQIGERFATRSDIFTVEQENFDIISKDVGETREDLAQLIERSDRAHVSVDDVSRQVKAFIWDFAAGHSDNKNLLTQVNQYFEDIVILSLSPEDQKTLNGREYASNIIPIAEHIRDHLGSYNRIDPATGRSVFNNLNLKFSVGRAEWEAARGRAESVGILGGRLDMNRRIIENTIDRNFKPRPAKIAEAVGIYSLNAVSNLLVYGIAGLGGVGKFGTSMASRAAFGLGGVAAITYSKESGFVFSHQGRLRGLSGRYLKEYSHASWSLTKGRKAPDKAAIFKELSEYMVKRVNAGDLIIPIANLLRQDNLSQSQVRELVFHIAHASARINLTDQSVKKKGLFSITTPQNFIQFEEGVENNQYRALRAQILAGVVKLYKAHISPARDLDIAQSIVEAQLRLGSSREVAKNWLIREHRMTPDNAEDAINIYYKDLHIEEKHGLNKSMARLARANIRRGLATAASAPIAGAALGVGAHATLAMAHGVSSEVAAIITDVQKGEPADYVKDWQNALTGKFELVENDLKVETNLTPIQQGMLILKAQSMSLGERLVSAFTGDKLAPEVQMTNIDGINIALPDYMHFAESADGSLHGFVDGRDGHVYDTTGYHFVAEDLNADGTVDLGLSDSAGHAVLAKDILGPGFDIKVETSSIPAVMPSVETHTEVTIPAVETKIETADEWTKHSTQIDRMEFYGYDQPGSQGNELGFHVVKSGDSLTLSMKGMGEAWSKSASPEHINVAGALENPGNHDGQIGFYLRLGGSQDQGVFIPANHGELVLNPNDHTLVTLPNGSQIEVGTLAKMTINKNVFESLPEGGITTEIGHRDLFNLGRGGDSGFIQAGNLKESDGILTFQSFATIHGTGEMPDIVESIQPAVTAEVFTPAAPEVVSTPVFIINPPDFVLPINLTEWILPIGIPSRRPLEASIAGHRPTFPTPVVFRTPPAPPVPTPPPPIPPPFPHPIPVEPQRPPVSTVAPEEEEENLSEAQNTAAIPEAEIPQEVIDFYQDHERFITAIKKYIQDFTAEEIADKFNLRLEAVKLAKTDDQGADKLTQFLISKIYKDEMINIYNSLSENERKTIIDETLLMIKSDPEVTETTKQWIDGGWFQKTEAALYQAREEKVSKEDSLKRLSEILQLANADEVKIHLKMYDSMTADDGPFEVYLFNVVGEKHNSEFISRVQERFGEEIADLTDELTSDRSEPALPSRQLNPPEEWFDKIFKNTVRDPAVVEDNIFYDEPGAYKFTPEEDKIIETADGRGTPFQVYRQVFKRLSDQEGKLFIRKLSSDALDLEMIDFDGRVKSIDSKYGLPAQAARAFVVEGKYYRLEGIYLVPLKDEEIFELENLMRV